MLRFRRILQWTRRLTSRSASPAAHAVASGTARLDRSRRRLLPALLLGAPASASAAERLAGRPGSPPRPGVVSPRDFGAAGDGVANDAPALQAAIAFCVANNRTLVLDDSVYVVTANLSVAGNLNVLGLGKAKSRLKASGSCTRILEFTDSALVRCELKGLMLDGNRVAAQAIYAPNCSHMTLESVQVTSCAARGTNSAAVHLGGGNAGQGGWNNVFIDVEVSYCAGDGVFLAGNNNSNVFVGCKIFANDGVGLVVQSSQAISALNTTFEANKKAGVFATAGVSNLAIENCPFYANAQTGITFATPPVTVRADIVLNGSSRTVMSNAFPNNGVRVSNCYTYPHDAAQDGFVFAAGYDALSVENCALEGSCPAAGIVPLVATHWSVNANRWPKLAIGSNAHFGPPLSFLGVAGVLAYNAQDIHILNVPQVNYAAENGDLNTWGRVAKGGVATWERVPGRIADGREVPVWAINSNAPGASEVFGFTRDAAASPALIGKYVMFAMMVKASSPGIGANLHVASAVNQAGVATNTNWNLAYGIFKWPATGTLTFGAVKHGGKGSCAFACPMLIEVGVDYHAVFGRFGKVTEFSGAAAPSTGAWSPGDKVWRSDGMADGVAGYVCVAGGSPGRWRKIPCVS